MSGQTPSHEATVMRSLLGRARGLGSARSGIGHWWAQRLTAIALVPLVVWFVISLLGHEGASRMDVAHWVANPVTATLLLALIVSLFHHMQLGLQVVIEDYVHTEPARLASLLAVKAVAILLALACAIAVLKLALLG